MFLFGSALHSDVIGYARTSRAFLQDGVHALLKHIPRYNQPERQTEDPVYRGTYTEGRIEGCRFGAGLIESDCPIPFVESSLLKNIAPLK